MTENRPAQPTPAATEQKRQGVYFASRLHPDIAPNHPTRLLLACHAQNVQSRASHLSPDEIGLSARGWEETTALAQWLYEHEDIDALLTDSPLRARLTAQRIGQRLGLSSQVLSYLPRGGEAEWALEPPQASIASLGPESLARYSAYAEGMLEACQRILAERWGKTTLLVASSTAIATIVRSFTGSPESGIQIGLTSLTELQYHDNRWSLAYSNRTEHLPQPVRPPRMPPTDAADPDRLAEKDLAAESEKSARFYDQLARRLRQESSHLTDGSGSASREVNGEMLYRFGELGEGRRLLLAGAGSGRLALDLALAGVSEVVGVDVSPGMLERAESLRLATQDTRLQRVNFRLAPVHALPFVNGRFDVALCVHLLHHLAKPLPALRELHRVLPAQGTLILIDVNGSPDAVKRATQNAIESKRNPTHTTIRTQAQWTALLQQSGFLVEKEQSWVVERKASEWLDSIAVDDATRLAVIEMLEASIETDAAGLHVRRQNGELHFDVPVIALLARKVAE
ncbi:MAG: methyltransferase domain-containing protein [Chloroflexi bacterium]|nr:MAG: methyltransferase domain-containing protein [Chloroflexota bacterium]